MSWLFDLAICQDCGCVTKRWKFKLICKGKTLSLCLSCHNERLAEGYSTGPFIKP